MTSPRLEAAAASTRTEAQVRAARLSAAAPKLLAALEHCATVMADCVLFPERDDENRAYSQAIAAIKFAKAQP